jgi:hypothetical protein
MIRTEVTCRIFCGGRIRHHWQLILLHATCKPPLIERAVRAIVAPPGEEGAPSLTWCRECNAYHMGLRAHFGRHAKRALTKLLREW